MSSFCPEMMADDECSKAAGFIPAEDSSPPSAAGAFDKVAAPPAGLWNAADTVGWFASCGYVQS
jgi:hypothetical protein